MRIFNVFLYFCLAGLALLGLYRLYADRASFSWILTIFYVGIATLMLLVNSVRWVVRRVTPDRNDDHSLAIITGPWAGVSMMSAVYGIAATAICLFIRHNNGLATLYFPVALVCLVIGIVAIIATVRANRKFAAAV